MHATHGHLPCPCPPYPAADPDPTSTDHPADCPTSPPNHATTTGPSSQPHAAGGSGAGARWKPYPQPESWAPEFEHCSPSFRQHLLSDPALASAVRVTLRYRKYGADCAVRYLGSLMTTDTGLNRARAVVPCVDQPSSMHSWEFLIESEVGDTAVCSGALVSQQRLPAVVGGAAAAAAGGSGAASAWSWVGEEGFAGWEELGPQRWAELLRRQLEGCGLGQAAGAGDRKAGEEGAGSGAGAKRDAEGDVVMGEAAGAAGGGGQGGEGGSAAAAAVEMAGSQPATGAAPGGEAAAAEAGGGGSGGGGGGGGAEPMAVDAAPVPNPQQQQEQQQQADGGPAAPAAPASPARPVAADATDGVVAMGISPPPAPPPPQPPPAPRRLHYYEQSLAVAPCHIHVTVGPLTVMSQYQGSTNQLLESIMQQEGLAAKGAAVQVRRHMVDVPKLFDRDPEARVPGGQGLGGSGDVRQRSLGLCVVVGRCVGKDGSVEGAPGGLGLRGSGEGACGGHGYRCKVRRGGRGVPLAVEASGERVGQGLVTKGAAAQVWRSCPGLVPAKQLRLGSKAGSIGVPPPPHRRTQPYARATLLLPVKSSHQAPQLPAWPSPALP